MVPHDASIRHSLPLFNRGLSRSRTSTIFKKGTKSSLPTSFGSNWLRYPPACLCSEHRAKCKQLSKAKHLDFVQEVFFRPVFSPPSPIVFDAVRLSDTTNTAHTGQKNPKVSPPFPYLPSLALGVYAASSVRPASLGEHGPAPSHPTGRAVRCCRYRCC